MIGLLQRVSSARVEVGGQLVGAFDYLAARVRAAHPDVQTGRFGADMRVSLVNEGPVTFWLEGRGGKGEGPRA